MNEEKIKELLSVSFVRLIAERAGYVVTRPSQDYGDDLLVKNILIEQKANKFQYFLTGELIGLQLKSTTKKGIKSSGKNILFDLNEKNYNHLVLRQSEWQKSRKSPLVLVLFILPENKKEWLSYEKEEGHLILKGKAYWYLPNENAVATKNKRKRRISISEKNLVDLETFHEFFTKFHPKKI